MDRRTLGALLEPQAPQMGGGAMMPPGVPPPSPMPMPQIGLQGGGIPQISGGTQIPLPFGDLGLRGMYQAPQSGNPAEYGGMVELKRRF